MDFYEDESDLTIDIFNIFETFSLSHTVRELFCLKAKECLGILAFKIFMNYKGRQFYFLSKRFS